MNPRNLSTSLRLSVTLWIVGSMTAICQSNVHRFGDITPRSGRAVALELLGSTPQTLRSYFDLYPIEASTDLAHWMPLASLLRTNVTTNALIYIDTEAEKFAHRFYRTPTNALITPFPKPTGSFPVGTTSLLLTDLTRTNRYVSTNSSFMISLWYPCEAVAGALPGVHYDRKVAQAYALFDGFVAHAIREAPPLRTPGVFPVVLYSHGATSERKDNSAKMQELASHGFVAVSIDHASCFVTVFPNGTSYTTGFTGSEVVTTKFFTNHLRDIQFVVAELERLNSEEGPFNGRLDLNRIGVMGWSFGGEPEAEFARTDDRVKAVIHLDTYLSVATALIETGLSKPFLGMYSTEVGGDRRLLNKATNDAYYLQIRNSTHTEFADLLVFSPADYVRRKTMIQNALVISFFNKYLNATNDWLLDNNPTNRFPEIVNFAKK